jgi:hypothetical protein
VRLILVVTYNRTLITVLNRIIRAPRDQFDGQLDTLAGDLPALQLITSNCVQLPTMPFLSSFQTTFITLFFRVGLPSTSWST